jgi:hypothetical protein
MNDISAASYGIPSKPKLIVMIPPKLQMMQGLKNTKGFVN